MVTTPSLQISLDQFLADFRANWKQGEHVLILGPTGTGKTTIATEIVDIRSYVAVIAVKRRDETLKLFKRKGYPVIKKWPPHYNQHKVIYWEKPDSLSDDLMNQSLAIHTALNNMYIAGGWCIYLDEAGYLAGTLGLGKDIGVLLNQGRSNYLSVVTTMTRPSSVIARVPKEALNQPRHKLIFKYTDDVEVKACASIMGMDWHNMQAIQQALGKHDFVYLGPDGAVTVLNKR